MSIFSEISRIEQAKADLKTQIENKGGTVGPGTIDTYDSAVQTIRSAAPMKCDPVFIIDYLDSSNNKTVADLQADMNNTDISGSTMFPRIGIFHQNVPDISTPVTTGHWNNLPNLVQVRGILGPTVSETSSIAGNSIEHLDMRGTDLSHATSYTRAFYNSYAALKSLDMSTCICSQQADAFGSMFYNLSKLETLNLGTWIPTQGTCTYMFYGLGRTAANGAPTINATNVAGLLSQKTLNADNMFANAGAITLQNFNTLVAYQDRTAQNQSCKLTNMFTNSYITEVDLTNFHPQNAEVASMFSNSARLQRVVLPNVYIKQNVGCARMFSGCTSLTSVDLSNWENTDNCRGYSGMFYNCTSLTTLDLSSFKRRINGSWDGMSSMFYNCTSLQHLDMRQYRFSGMSASDYTDAFTNVPTNCEIIVADNTEKSWFANNWPALTNVKTVAEISGLSIVSINGSYNTGTETGEVVVTFSENIIGNGPDHGEDPVEVYYDDGQGTIYSNPFYMSGVTISGATMTCPIPDNYLESYILDGTARFRMVAGFVEGTTTSTLNQAVDSAINWTITN